MSDGGDLKVRDFGKSTGLSARRILEDACRSRDASARLSLRQVSPTVYACRHSVTIEWTKAQEAPLDVPDIDVQHSPLGTSVTMISIAAVNAQQSEAFVSVAALFCIFSMEVCLLQLWQINAGSRRIPFWS